MYSHSPSSSESYWRNRYGMPPRRAEAFPRARPRVRVRATARLRASVACFAFRRRSPRKLPRFARNLILKISAVLLFAVWIAWSGVTVLHEAPQGPLGAAGLSSTVETYLSAMQGERRSTAQSHGPVSFDALLAEYAEANEATLVALRGFVLTGSAGFRTEWMHGRDRLRNVQAAVARDSRSWTDGTKLVAFAALSKDVDQSLDAQRLLVDLAPTSNRYPGRRVYDEDVAPAFAEMLSLCDTGLQSILASNWPDAAANANVLASLRGQIRTMRQQMPLYLSSAENAPSSALQANIDALRQAATQLQGLRGKVAPADQARLDRIAVLLQQTSGKVDQLLQLKRSDRWDYADYSFRQKILPGAERISATLAAWRKAS